jgi:hypothetical protein
MLVMVGYGGIGALQMESMQRDQKKLLSLMANQEKLIAELRLRAVGGI